MERLGDITIMHIHEHAAMLMARERMADARRHAGQMRALRLARTPRRSARVRLGMALIRLGRWIQGQPSPTPEGPIGIRQSQS